MNKHNARNRYQTENGADENAADVHHNVKRAQVGAVRVGSGCFFRRRPIFKRKVAKIPQPLRWESSGEIKTFNKSTKLTIIAKDKNSADINEFQKNEINSENRAK